MERRRRSDNGETAFVLALKMREAMAFELEGMHVDGDGEPVEVAMANETAEIILFRIRKKLTGGSQSAVRLLPTHQLLLTAFALMNLAVNAHEVSDDANFYELI